MASRSLRNPDLSICCSVNLHLWLSYNDNCQKNKNHKLLKGDASGIGARMVWVKAAIVFIINFLVYIYIYHIQALFSLKIIQRIREIVKDKGSFHIPLVQMSPSQRNHADHLSKMPQSLFSPLRSSSVHHLVFIFLH